MEKLMKYFSEFHERVHPLSKIRRLIALETNRKKREPCRERMDALVRLSYRGGRECQQILKCLINLVYRPSRHSIRLFKAFVLLEYLVRYANDPIRDYWQEQANELADTLNFVFLNYTDVKAKIVAKQIWLVLGVLKELKKNDTIADEVSEAVENKPRVPKVKFAMDFAEQVDELASVDVDARTNTEADADTDLGSDDDMDNEQFYDCIDDNIQTN